MIRATLAEFVDEKVGLEVFGKSYDPLDALNKLLPELNDADLLSEDVMCAYNIELRTTNLGTVKEPNHERYVTLTPIEQKSFYSFTLRCLMENSIHIVIRYESLSDAKKDAWLFGALATDVPEITCIRYTRETRKNPARQILSTKDVFTEECAFWK